MALHFLLFILVVILALRLHSTQASTPRVFTWFDLTNKKVNPYRVTCRLLAQVVPRHKVGVAPLFVFRLHHLKEIKPHKMGVE